MNISLLLKSVRKSTKGFTIVELLVVISIIALLIALLLPALARARKLALTTECLSNLNQQGVVMQMYTDQFEGMVPIAEDGTGQMVPYGYPPFYWWFYQGLNVGIQPTYQYNGQTYRWPGASKIGTIFVCPVAAAEHPILPMMAYPSPNSGQAWWWSATYSENYWCGWLSNNIKEQKITSVIHPGDTMFMGDGWYNPNLFTWNVLSPGGGPLGPDWPDAVHGSLNRTNGTGLANFLFFDGHAETLDTAKIPAGGNNYLSPFWSGDGSW